MASTIQLKTGTGSAVPTSVTQGEVGINIDNAVYTNAALSEGDMMMLDVSLKSVDNGTNPLITVDLTA